MGIFLSTYYHVKTRFVKLNRFHVDETTKCSIPVNHEFMQKRQVIAATGSWSVFWS